MSPQRVHKIIRRFELLTPIAFEFLVAEPVIVQPSLILYFWHHSLSRGTMGFLTDASSPWFLTAEHR